MFGLTRRTHFCTDPYHKPGISKYQSCFIGYPGDSDPMDLFDISQDPGYYGQVKQSKILGGLSVVNDDETDWKMMGIDMKNPLAAVVNSIEEVEKYRPVITQAFYDWFDGFQEDKTLIISTGDQDQIFCLQQVAESHDFWKDLVSGTAYLNEFEIAHTSNENLITFTSCMERTKDFELRRKSKPIKPAEIPTKFQGRVFQ
ncbi:inorganic pyrophosphatase [Stagonosporopsis vannaccii]|nr:inorganic pyrophosphatase [Stagonosporopsis vannaccii]